MVNHHAHRLLPTLGLGPHDALSRIGLQKREAIREDALAKMTQGPHPCSCDQSQSRACARSKVAENSVTCCRHVGGLALSFLCGAVCAGSGHVLDQVC